jgi:hypothetical protein
MTTFLDHIRKAMTFATPEPSPVRVWLPDAYGAAVYDAQISKGAGHKYIKRVPVGTTKSGATRYRYYYEVQHGAGVHNEDHFVEGSAFKHDGGHFHVKAVDGDTLTIVHDETGQSKKVSRKALVEMLASHHGKALDAHKAKVAADLAATEKHGSPKQKARMRAHAAKWGVGDDEDDAGFRETMREQGERMRDADAPRPRAKATKPDPTDAESLRSAVASEWPILRHATAETLQHFRTIPSVRGAIGKWDDATVLSAVGEMGATAKAPATPPQPKPEAKGAAAASAGTMPTFAKPVAADPSDPSHSWMRVQARSAQWGEQYPAHASDVAAFVDHIATNRIPMDDTASVDSALQRFVSLRAAARDAGVGGDDKVAATWALSGRPVSALGITADVPVVRPKPAKALGDRKAGEMSAAASQAKHRLARDADAVKAFDTGSAVAKRDADAHIQARAQAIVPGVHPDEARNVVDWHVKTGGGTPGSVPDAPKWRMRAGAPLKKSRGFATLIKSYIEARR